MAITTNVILTATYQLIVDNVNYSIQNVSRAGVELVFSDTTPADTLKGIVIRERDGVITDWGIGKIWARGDGGMLAITLDSLNCINNNNPISDYMLNVSRGLITDVFPVNKFGANIVSAKDVQEDVWDGGGTYNYPTIALMTHLHQLSNDNPSMQVKVYGLDSSWDLVEQTVTLDATDSTTLVELDTPLLRAFRMKIVSNEVSASDITLVNSANTVVYAQIDNDNNQTLMAMYSVPKGYTAYMTRVYADVVESTGKEPKSTDFKLWVRDNANNQPFQLKSARGLPKAGAAIENKFIPYFKITEKSDIKTTTYCVDEPGFVHAGFDLILIKNI